MLMLIADEGPCVKSIRAERGMISVQGGSAMRQPENERRALAAQLHRRQPAAADCYSKPSVELISEKVTCGYFSV
jgi:hypothetical protein